MARIAVDIDSTLYDFPTLACQTMGEMATEPMYAEDSDRLRNAAYSTTWSEWRTPLDLAGLDNWQDVVDRCHHPDVIRAQTPYPGAKEALWGLHYQGHKLIYVSNRNSETKVATFDWLITHGFPIHDLKCHSEDKLASIRDCKYLIDDRPKTLVGFISDYSSDFHPFFRKAFGLVMPYNRNLTDIPGIYLAPSWPLLEHYLRAKVPSAA